MLVGGNRRDDDCGEFFICLLNCARCGIARGERLLHRLNYCLRFSERPHFCPEPPERDYVAKEQKEAYADQYEDQMVMIMGMRVGIMCVMFMMIMR